MDGFRYRSYVVRIWLADPAEPALARARVEWIAPGIEVEVRGEPAADLAARLERILDPASADDHPQARDEVGASDRGRH